MENRKLALDCLTKAMEMTESVCPCLSKVVKSRKLFIISTVDTTLVSVGNLGEKERGHLSTLERLPTVHITTNVTGDVFSVN